jgi:hypothetical protein
MLLGLKPGHACDPMPCLPRWTLSYRCRRVRRCNTTQQALANAAKGNTNHKLCRYTDDAMQHCRPRRRFHGRRNSLHSIDWTYSLDRPVPSPLHWQPEMCRYGAHLCSPPHTPLATNLGGVQVRGSPLHRCCTRGKRAVLLGFTPLLGLKHSHACGQ